jgi:hypothetical protein
MRSFLLSCFVMLLMGAGAAQAERGVSPSEMMSEIRSAPRSSANLIRVEGLPVIEAEIAGYRFIVMFDGCEYRNDGCGVMSFLSFWRVSGEPRRSVMEALGQWNVDTNFSKASMEGDTIVFSYGIVTIGGLTDSNKRHQIGGWLAVSQGFAEFMSGRTSSASVDAPNSTLDPEAVPAEFGAPISRRVERSLQILEEQGLWTGHHLNVVEPTTD